MKRVVFVLSLAFAGTCLAGVNSWTVTGPDGGPAHAVAFVPGSSPAVIVGASWSIYRSNDGAQSWTEVRDRLSNGITRILVDPTNPNRVIASGITSMYRSDDGGRNFAAVSAPGTTSNLAMPADGSVLYAASGSSDTKLYRTADFGATWQTFSSLPTGNFVNDLVVDPVDPSTVYALVESKGLYKSTDKGQSWALVNALPNLVAKKLAIDPGAPTQMLLATYNGQLQASSDSGASWALAAGAPQTAYVWVGYMPAAAGASGAAVAIPALGRVIHRIARNQSWIAGADFKLGNASDAAFDPSSTDANNTTVIIATGEGPLVSHDSGATFAVRSQGIRALSVTNLVAARDPQGMVYASAFSGPLGIHRRTLSGWNALDNAALLSDVPNAFQPVSLAVDPVDPQALIVGAAYALMNSYDGGQSWSGPNFDFNNLLVTTAQFAPSNPVIAYLGTLTDGVYRSETRGLTWFKRANGLPANIAVVAVDPTTPEIAYAAVRRPAAALVFKTIDGGATWTPAGAGLDAESIESLVIDPVNPQTLYAGGFGSTRGVFKSTNGGQSWARVGAPASDYYGASVAIDPVVNSTVFMSVNEFGEASRSVDGGATWERLPALPRDVLSLGTIVLDPLKPSNAIAATNGYGLIELEVAPDLAVSFSSMPPNTMALGASGAATLRVANHGPFAASAVVVNVSAQAGVTLSSPTPGQGSCAAAAGGFRCALGALSTNQAVDIPLTLTAGAVAVQSGLSAQVTGHESDPAPNDNTVSAPVAVARVADLGVALSTSAATLDHHAPLTLTATATNSGPNPSTAAQVTIGLGTVWGYQSATSSKGSCSQSGVFVTCSLGVLDPATSATMAITMTAEGVGLLSASAGISDSGVQDPNATNNTNAVGVTSQRVADLAVQITDAADPVTAGQALAYTATVTNNGPDDVVSATVTVNVTGATVTGATTTGGTCVPGNSSVSCTLSFLANGASTTVSIATSAGSAGTATANATVGGGGTDKTSNNDAATQSTTVNAPPVTAPAASGGGGGAFGELELLALLALVLGRGRLRRSR
jgi:photosystem II stability/assembly factor-like uncharacterized protein